MPEQQPLNYDVPRHPRDPILLKELGLGPGDVPRVCPLTGITLGPPFPQEWSPKGYPIVDGKYFDGQTGRVVTLAPDDRQTVGGPPQVDVYWHNRTGHTGEDHFCGFIEGTNLTVTEYIGRVGKLFEMGKDKCELHSLNATTYSVNVIVFTDLTLDEMDELLKESGLMKKESGRWSERDL